MWHYFMKLTKEEKLLMVVIVTLLMFLYLKLFGLLGFAVIVSVVFLVGIGIISLMLKTKLTKLVNERYRQSSK